MFLTASFFKFGGPRATRTPNLLIRSQMLYPIELWDRVQILAQKKIGAKAGVFSGFSVQDREGAGTERYASYFSTSVSSMPLFIGTS